MKPTNKHQVMIVELDKSLKKISKTAEDWAFKNVLVHAAVRNKSGNITCLDCGGSWQGVKPEQGWQDEVMGNQQCPHCHTPIKIETTLKRNFRQDKHYTVIDTHKGHQVIRTFEIFGFHKKGSPKRVYSWEKSRIYITPKGKYEIIGQNHQSSYYGERWWGEFSLKQKSTIHAHTLHPDAYYPKQKIIPEITRNGYRGDLHQLTPWTVFDALLNNKRAETLFKIGQISLFWFSINDYNHLIERFWDTLKVCFKKEYVIEEAKDYFDYLMMLERYNRDLKSPRYVCPVNFKREHDRYVERERKDRVKQTIAENLKQIKKDEKDYRLNKAKFFGLAFTDEHIVIEPLKSVKEFVIVGDVLRHCIYSSSYHRKSNSLLMIATIDNKPIETIEIYLDRLQISQARGFGNKSSIYHDQIINLVQSNMVKIQEVLKPKVKRVRKQALKSA